MERNQDNRRSSFVHRPWSVTWILLLILLPSSLFAHDLYIRAEPFRLEEDGTISVSMRLADSFPGEEILWRREKTIEFLIFGPGSDGKRKINDQELSNPNVQVTTEGTYLIGWTGTPSFIEIEPEKFNDYLAIEGYLDVIQMRKNSGKEMDPGRERYSRYLKTFIQVGAKTTDHYGKILGQKMEIIPLKNPYSLKTDSELAVRVLYEGVPLANLLVKATYDSFSTKSEDYAQTVKTDYKGIAKFRITKAGLWMIRANKMIPLKNDPEADWESYWANFTFEAR